MKMRIFNVITRQERFIRGCSVTVFIAVFSLTPLNDEGVIGEGRADA